MAKIGLKPGKLQEIFIKINQNRGDTTIGNELYNAYLPAVEQYAKQFKLTEEQVLDIYSEIIAYLHNNIASGIIRTPKEFCKCFNTLMEKQCDECANTKQNEIVFSSEMLAKVYDKRVKDNIIPSQVERMNTKVFNEQSLIFTIQLLTALQNNDKLAREYGLSALKIEMFKDHCGLNDENRAYTVEEIAVKFNTPETRVRAMLANTKKAIRHIKEFEPIVNR